MKKKLYFYVAIDILLWLVNTLVLLFNHQRIRLNLLSALALIPILMMVIQAIQSYQYRHCENILKEPPLRGTLRYRAKTHKSEQTYSDEYMAEFSWMLTLYVGVISFQPLVFVWVSPQFQFLVSFFLLMLPYVCYFVAWIFQLIRKGKAMRQKALLLEQERLEQERREEEGRWK